MASNLTPADALFHCLETPDGASPDDPNPFLDKMTVDACRVILGLEPLHCDGSVSE